MKSRHGFPGFRIPTVIWEPVSQIGPLDVTLKIFLQPDKMLRLFSNVSAQDNFRFMEVHIFLSDPIYNITYPFLTPPSVTRFIFLWDSYLAPVEQSTRGTWNDRLLMLHSSINPPFITRRRIATYPSGIRYFSVDIVSLVLSLITALSASSSRSFNTFDC